MIPLKDDVPGKSFPVLTTLLIALSLITFVWQIGLSSSQASNFDLARAEISVRDEALVEYGAIPFRLSHPGAACGAAQGEILCGDNEGSTTEAGGPGGTPIPDNLGEAPWWSTPISSLFLHGDVLHLLINMLFLWIFGRTLEGLLGRWKLALLYLAAGIVSVYAQALLDPDSTAPIIGASGAVAGVLGAYVLMYPRARVVSLVLIPFVGGVFLVPAGALIAAWFLIQLIPEVGRLATPDIGSGGGFAYIAPVAGFLLGLALIHPLARASGDPERPTMTTHGTQP